MDREFIWTDADFSRVQNLIYHRAGISLHDGKHAMVYSRLSRRLREKNINKFSDYLNFLEVGDQDEWQEFVNALTTNLTSFFREKHHFVILSGYLKSISDKKNIRIWCSAASTGEEPYSIAITAAESLGITGKFEIIASDIDSRVLESAGAGIYREDQLTSLSDIQKKNFLLRGKESRKGFFRVKKDIKSKINFFNVNLTCEDWPFRELFQVVFCRNVMIYFDSKTQRRVLEKIHSVMVPGGLLFVGHAENFSESRDLFVLRGQTVYMRV